MPRYPVTRVTGRTIRRAGPDREKKRRSELVECISKISVCDRTSNIINSDGVSTLRITHAVGVGGCGR
jgi:hypothetical protein